MREPMMSGHCANPETAHPERSHGRCHANGAGNWANPRKEFSPCPCSCHVEPDPFECECGDQIYLAPALGVDEDGDEIYVHLNEDGSRIIIGECP